jgi:transcription initiation factor TFIIB
MTNIDTIDSIDTIDLNNLWGVFKDNKNNEIENNNKGLSNFFSKCSECDSTDLISDEGFNICTNCGALNDGVIDSCAEWRFYGNDDSKSSDPNRCGLPTNELLPESSLGSTISFRYGESYEMKKIRNYHTWNAMPYKERSLYNVFDAIQIRAINSGIPSCIIEEAKILYKKISETRISRGSNRKGIIASCIYKACKLKKVPRSAKEIAEIFQLPITHMTKGCKKFDEIMNFNKSDKSTIDIVGSKSNDFIARFCSKLNISNDVLEICKSVCEAAEKYSLVSENTPPSVAAGSIFLVCTLLNINISKKDISNSCKISEVTISKCYKKLLRYHQHLLPKDIINKLY